LQTNIKNMKKINVLLSLFIGISLLAQNASNPLDRVDVTLPTLPPIPEVTLPSIPEVTPKPSVPGTQYPPKIDVQIVVPPVTGPTLPVRPRVAVAEPIPVVASYIRKLYKRPTDKTYTKIELRVTGVVPTAGWTNSKLLLVRKSNTEVTYSLVSLRPAGAVTQVITQVTSAPLTIDVTKIKQVTVLSKGKPLVVWKAELRTPQEPTISK
jgi:hypothetical protein